MASLAERIRAYDVADYSNWLDCVTNAQRAAETLVPSIGQARGAGSSWTRWRHTIAESVVVSGQLRQHREKATQRVSSDNELG